MNTKHTQLTIKSTHGAPTLREGGTKDFANWQMADLVTNLYQIKVGDFLFDDDGQFDALNLCQVTKLDSERGLFYAHFVNPTNPAQGRLGGRFEPDFCVWDFKLTNNPHGSRFLKAFRPEPENQILKPTESIQGNAAGNQGVAIINMLVDTANASMEDLRARVTNVRYADSVLAVQCGYECILFEFDGVTHLGEMSGRYHNTTCIGVSTESDKRIAVGLLLDKYAVKFDREAMNSQAELLHAQRVRGPRQ